MNLKIMKAPYLAVMEWEVEEGKLDEAAKIWINSKVSNFFENSVLYKGLTKNSLVVLYEVTNFSVIQQFVESDEFKQFVKAQAKYMQSDFHQSIVGLVEDVIRRKQLIPKTKYMQLRSIEVPLSDIDSYLEWRKRRIFEFVKRNDKVTSFLAFHSVFSTVPGVLFVTEFEGNPDEYRASFLTDEYKQIAGHDHIKSGEQGLQTFEYEKVE